MDKNKHQTLNPGLYLVSTPIGNMEDITYRALNVLNKSEIILCEDTRRSAKLISYYKIKNKLVSYHKFNEKKMSEKAINFIKEKKIVSLISDAGTPAISDPGLLLIKKCINEKLNVSPIPGPSAPTSAISVSGFSDKYLFYGFLPKKEQELEKILNNLCNFEYSIVFFASASKINFFIKKFKLFFSDREILVAREMTKIHENFTRNSVKSINFFPENLKGELTIVLSNKSKEKRYEKKISESVKSEIKNMLSKYSLKDVVEYISKKENIQKKMIYNYCLKNKKSK
tara:strand:- start:211 stop:1065 length:855 start_codon:yes stop_codon:yes gene_type:complete